MITGLCAYCLKQKLNLTVKDGWEMKYFYDRPADKLIEYLTCEECKLLPAMAILVKIKTDWVVNSDE